MVMSELTGGVDMMGLLVFQIDESYGRYIDPDQQEDSPRQQLIIDSDDFCMNAPLQGWSYWCRHNPGRRTASLD